MLAAADQRVYLPMWGFTMSLNARATEQCWDAACTEPLPPCPPAALQVAVATGNVLQMLLMRWPQIQGAMSVERRQALRLDWCAVACCRPQRPGMANWASTFAQRAQSCHEMMMNWA
jgi:hypothetical protein